MAAATMHLSASLRGVGAPRARQQAMRAMQGCVSYHAQPQAAPTASRVTPFLAALPQRRVPPRARGGALVVRASWGAPVEFTPAKILETQPAATQLCRITVDLGPLAEGYKVPGQFIQIKVGESKPGFFAIASAPDPNNAGVVELLIKEQPGSTAELLCQAKAGDEVLVSPVMGKGFPVDRVPPATHPTLLLFATGSGVSPIKALLESEEALGAGQRREVRLYYGARTPEAMAYRERVPEWEAAGVNVVQVFSDNGGGYVQDKFAADAGIEDWSGVAAVLCGQKGMCEAVTELLTSKGVAKEHILLNF